jgi:hypothetical protein
MRPLRASIAGSGAAGVVVAAVLVSLAAFAGCNVVTSVAVQGADFGGGTADVHCDRRFVVDGGQRSSFCQEVQATVAASAFSDDCRNHLLATSGPGLCPRSAIIAGCLLDTHYPDHSIVRDWYYDVSDILTDAGAFAGPDGGPTFADPLPQDTTEVGAVCADMSRYPSGAEMVMP